jgi:hypothetical protein
LHECYIFQSNYPSINRALIDSPEPTINALVASDLIEAVNIGGNFRASDGDSNNRT